jgi:hypothetical protein
MSRRDLSVKGETSERCYRTRRGWTDEQRYAIITNISFLAKLFFKTFISLKHLSDYRTVGLSGRRTIRLSDCRIIATAPSDNERGEEKQRSDRSESTGQK